MVKILLLYSISLAPGTPAALSALYSNRHTHSSPGTTLSATRPTKCGRSVSNGTVRGLAMLNTMGVLHISSPPWLVGQAAAETTYSVISTRIWEMMSTGIQSTWLCCPSVVGKAPMCLEARSMVGNHSRAGQTPPLRMGPEIWPTRMTAAGSPVDDAYASSICSATYLDWE